MARLNVQGLARRDPGLMSCILPDSGYKTVSLDLSAGEPTVTAHLSQDRRYRYATFDGVGKAPYYEGGVLMLDDVYLMTQSVSPIGAAEIRRVFDSHQFPEGNFVEQWLKDPEVVKKFFKAQRQLHKMLCVAKGTLIRVRGQGWQAIELVKPGAEVWDGDSWVTTDGPVFNGVRPTIDRHGLTATPDHLILTAQGWAPMEEATDACKARPPAATWSDVWAMVRSFLSMCLANYCRVSYNYARQRYAAGATSEERGHARIRLDELRPKK